MPARSVRYGFEEGFIKNAVNKSIFHRSILSADGMVREYGLYGTVFIGQKQTLKIQLKI